MTKSLLSLILISVISLNNFAQDREVSIIPKPNKIVRLSGEFVFRKDVPIVLSDASLRPIANYFNNRIKAATGFSLGVSSNDETGETIRFFLDPSITQKEDYRLVVNEKGLAISASTPNGLFYGIQTLLQLLPTPIYSKGLVADANWVIPHVEITDAPRFGYRGVMLDVSRYFLSKEDVKQMIDLLALHKLNTFHWHLTDDQGWRIEIKKYPKLTEIGSKRRETLVGHLSKRPHRYDGVPHQGYYSQEDVKEIVAYAQERFITIIPEIEMPGHSSAALAAYPELACNDGTFEVSTTWGVHKNLYCPTEETFLFLEDVLTEVMALFPSEYIHVGGDEAVKQQWKKSKFCQDLIREHGLKNEQGLQSYFIHRIDRFLSSKGRKLIGWDEILDGGLSPNATVMSWRGVEGGIAAAKQGHDVVMSPTSHCYFDYYQSKDKKKEPLTIGGFIPLSAVYGFEPIPEGLSEDEAKHILGAQGNIWAEYISTLPQAQYMATLRIAALSEVNWSSKETRNWDDFKQRLNTQLERYDALGYNYSKHVE